MEKIVHMDGMECVSECVQTVHCAGDCTDIQHITTHELSRGGETIAEIYDNSCRKGERIILFWETISYSEMLNKLKHQVLLVQKHLTGGTYRT